MKQMQLCLFLTKDDGKAAGQGRHRRTQRLYRGVDQVTSEVIVTNFLVIDAIHEDRTESNGSLVMRQLSRQG